MVQLVTLLVDGVGEAEVVLDYVGVDGFGFGGDAG